MIFLLYNQGKIDSVTIAVVGQFAENVYFGKPCGLMDQMACSVGKEVLLEVSMQDILQNISELRLKTNDRAVLRAIHFICENERVNRTVHALENKDIDNFLKNVKESGNSSYKFLQDVYTNSDVEHQNVSLALAVSEIALTNNRGVCRVHGGGFAGTIQAFVKNEYVNEYVQSLNSVFGIGACKVLKIRKYGGMKVL